MSKCAIPTELGYDKYKDLNLSIIRHGNIMDKIAKDYRLEITDMEIDDKYDCWGDDAHTNCSHRAGREIINGRYKNKKRKLAGFLHEIGHGLISDKFGEQHGWDTFMCEIEASFQGIQVAEKYGIKISKQDKQWLYRGAVRSYVDYK